MSCNASPRRIFPAAATNFSGGFTLLEMLMVMAIIAIVAVFTLPATSGMLQGSQLSQGGQIFGDQIALARQQAVSTNHSIEVRFYRFGDPESPGEKKEDPATGAFRGVQTFEVLDSGTVALGKVQRLPGPIIIDSGATLSTLIQPNGADSAPLSKSGEELKIKLPTVDSYYDCVSFRFLPDGSTDLPKDKTWFLTLHRKTGSEPLTNPPSDFITIQVDPYNGKIQSYRP